VRIHATSRHHITIIPKYSRGNGWERERKSKREKQKGKGENAGSCPEPNKRNETKRNETSLGRIAPKQKRLVIRKV